MLFLYLYLSVSPLAIPCNITPCNMVMIRTSQYWEERETWPSYPAPAPGDQQLQFLAQFYTRSRTGVHCYIHARCTLCTHLQSGSHAFSGLNSNTSQKYLLYLKPESNIRKDQGFSNTTWALKRNAQINELFSIFWMLPLHKSFVQYCSQLSNQETLLNRNLAEMTWILLRDERRKNPTLDFQGSNRISLFVSIFWRWSIFVEHWVETSLLGIKFLMNMLVVVKHDAADGRWHNLTSIITCDREDNLICSCIITAGKP